MIWRFGDDKTFHLPRIFLRDEVLVMATVALSCVSDVVQNSEILNRRSKGLRAIAKNSLTQLNLGGQGQEAKEHRIEHP